MKMHIARESIVFLLNKHLQNTILTKKIEQECFLQADTPKKYLQYIKPFLINCMTKNITTDLVMKDSKRLEPYIILEMRDIIQMMFFRTLQKHIFFKKNTDLCTEYAQKIEASCYHYTYQQQEKTFLEEYSTRCGTINHIINCEKKSHQQQDNDALNKLISGELKPEAIGSMTFAELCPSAALKEKTEITLRSQQKVAEKTSQLYKCPNCKQRMCTYREVQTRALDEPSTIFCTCKKCGHEFIG
ncbi:pI243L [African swine fever virus]|nr:pI243L (k9L) [African swine fever virus]